MKRALIRDADWLRGERARAYAWLLALGAVLQIAVVVVTSSGGVDAYGMLLGTDFISFWTAGRMLVQGAPVYDTAAHIAAQTRYFARPNEFSAFFYPPFFLPWCYPLGSLPYFPALGLWLIATGTAFVLAIQTWFRHLALDWPKLLLIVGFPPVAITVLHGQTSFLLAALLGCGALWIRANPWLAGVLLGAAIIKTQFGILVPLVLVCTGEWRSFVAAAGTAVALGAIATLSFGVGIWSAWWGTSALATQALSSGMIGFAKMVSPFASARLIGAPSDVAFAFQAAVSVAVGASLAWASWRLPYTLGHGAAMLAAAPLVTPFALDYDLLVLAFPLIYVAATGFRPWEKIICAAVFAAPLFGRPLALATDLPIMAPLLAAFYLLLLRRLASPKAEPFGDADCEGGACRPKV